MRCIWNGMDNLTVVTVVSQPGMRFANQRLQATFCFIGKVSPFGFAKPISYTRTCVHVYACAYTYVRIRVREANGIRIGIDNNLDNLSDCGDFPLKP